MKSLLHIGTVALLALAVFAAAPTAAMEEEYTFVVLLTDPAADQGTGAGGYYDILEVAAAEPGDDTILFRTTVTDASDFVDVGGVRGVGSIRLDFNINDATAYQITMDTKGTSPGDDHAESCSVDGNTFLCIVKYSKLAAKVGDQVTGLKVTTKVVNNADTATGDDYTLAGLTAVETEGEAEVETEALTGTEAEVKANFTEATNKTIVYTWTNTMPSVVLGYDVTVGSGGVGVKIEVNNTTLDETALTETGNGTVPVPEAPQGEWTITLTFSGFTGDLLLYVKAADATDGLPGTGTDGTSAETEGNGTDLDDKETKDSPGLAFLPAVGLLAILALVVRRRLA